MGFFFIYQCIYIYPQRYCAFFEHCRTQHLIQKNIWNSIWIWLCARETPSLPLTNGDRKPFWICTKSHSKLEHSVTSENRKIPRWSGNCIQNRVESETGFFSRPWKPTAYGTMCSSEMFKQTLLFWSREHGTGPWKGQTLTKGRLPGSSHAAVHMWTLNEATHQGAERAGLLQGEKLGNEGNLNEAPHGLNRTRLIVVIEFIDSPRLGEIKSQWQHPSRKHSQERRLKMGLWHSCKVHSGYREESKLPCRARNIAAVPFNKNIYLLLSWKAGIWPKKSGFPSAPDITYHIGMCWAKKFCSKGDGQSFLLLVCRVDCKNQFN